jgi:hypothetical protein
LLFKGFITCLLENDEREKRRSCGRLGLIRDRPRG